MLLNKTFKLIKILQHRLDSFLVVANGMTSHGNPKTLTSGHYARENFLEPLSSNFGFFIIWDLRVLKGK